MRCPIINHHICFCLCVVGVQMAQQEPLYDFPEPSQASQRKILPHQRGQGSLRSISVLDRLLLTVPVWLQLSINPATALHILRREPPGVRHTNMFTIHRFSSDCTSSLFTHSAALLPLFLLSCRHSSSGSLAHPRGMCCVSDWPTTACLPLSSSLASRRNSPVKVRAECL
uniref:Secreted protein n=1 Tax=Salarias fasciatus TaxID=181472 RepID=A0A672G245_SALFA